MLRLRYSKTGRYLPVFFLVVFLLNACDIEINKKESTNPDPLPSWNEGERKQRILDFVMMTTDPESEYYIPENDRIAVFDNDGTLWSERPLYFQFYFVIDRIKELSVDHPHWLNKQPFKAALEDDMESVLESGKDGVTTLLMTAQSGMTSEKFQQIVKEWIDTARHPETGLLYKEMVFQPMLEVLDYLRANGFKTYIVSGGGLDFMRPWTEELYGIPPEQVIGSRMKSRFAFVDKVPVIEKLPHLELFNDKEEKPISINNIIGKKPVAAFGNSDGDLAMLQWTASGEGDRLMVYIHHTDSTREWAYDRKSHVGRLDKGLDEAMNKGWLVVDMKSDWKVIW